MMNSESEQAPILFRLYDFVLDDFVPNAVKWGNLAKRSLL